MVDSGVWSFLVHLAISLDEQKWCIMFQENTKKKEVQSKWISGKVTSRVMLDIHGCKDTVELTKKVQKRSLFERIEKLKASMN